MKIDNAAISSSAPERVQADAPRSAGARGHAGPSAPTDEVALSDQARAVAQAVTKAGDADDVRADVVARAREAVARGEVGTDLERLADRMIDDLLD